MEQPLTIAVNKINVKIVKEGCSMGYRFWPNADPAAWFERM
jgi:hypothetical protein